MSDGQDEQFTVLSSRVFGVLGLALVAVFLVLGLTGLGGDYHPAAYAIAGLVGALIWVTVLRPAVAIEGDRLVLRNAFSTVHIPLAAIEQVAVRRWLAVLVGDRHYTNSGISRTRRQGVRDDQHADVTGLEISLLSYGAIVERRIYKRAEDARMMQGVALYSDEQEALAADVRRHWAWPEIVAVSLLALASVVTLFL